MHTWFCHDIMCFEHSRTISDKYPWWDTRVQTKCNKTGQLPSFILFHQQTSWGQEWCQCLDGDHPGDTEVGLDTDHEDLDLGARVQPQLGAGDVRPVAEISQPPQLRGSWHRRGGQKGCRWSFTQSQVNGLVAFSFSLVTKIYFQDNH